MFREASSILGSAGFDHYEVSSYARPGNRCIHNRAYWANEPFWGFGMGATSHIGGARLPRPRIMREYSKCVPAIKHQDPRMAWWRVSAPGRSAVATCPHLRPTLSCSRLCLSLASRQQPITTFCGCLAGGSNVSRAMAGRRLQSVEPRSSLRGQLMSCRLG